MVIAIFVLNPNVGLLDTHMGPIVTCVATNLPVVISRGILVGAVKG